MNFNLVKNVFENNGFKMLKFGKQSSMLVDFGIIDIAKQIQSNAGFKVYQNAILQIKHLIDPRVMGDKFRL